MAALVARSLAFVYGFLVFSYLSVRAVLDGYIVKRPSKRFWALVEEERARLWTLSQSPPGFSQFRHAFLTLPSSPCRQMHYLTNAPPRSSSSSSNSSPSTGKPLLILLHGWPDTPYLFSRSLSHLSPSFLASTTIIAPSLPGFGASDSLPSYTVSAVMNAVSEFVLRAREAYSPSKVVLCGHDWGGLVAARLLCEPRHGDDAVGWLVDAGVLGNTAIPAHASRVVERDIANFRNVSAAWRRNPSSARLLREAGTAIRPVAAQVARSGYVFLFNLPRGLVSAFLNLGAMWFLRAVCIIALGREAGENEAREKKEEIQARYLAGLLGPGQEVLETLTEEREGYSDEVKKRVRKLGLNPHTETIRYYREGLASDVWTHKSAVVLESALRPKARQPRVVDEADETVVGRVQVPVEFVWGKGDPALDERICIRDVERCLKKGGGGMGGAVRKVEKGSHWFLSREHGSQAWAEVCEAMVGEAVEA